jgi:hypothetical protein
MAQLARGCILADGRRQLVDDFGVGRQDTVGCGMFP